MTIRIGSGAGFADDRIDPAVRLAREGRLDYLVFECLAERTIARAQLSRLRDRAHGYDRRLAARMQAVLETCVRQRVRVVTNMGAANPLGAARKVAEIARSLGLRGVRVAAVTGDDVLERVRGRELPLLDRPGTVASLGESVVSANAYLGAAPVAEALAGGADVVVTGRVADPALYLAPMIHEFGWSSPALVGVGIGVGHLLECAGQVTGGNHADPGRLDVPGLADLGFPLAEVTAEGRVTITKVPGTGGRVTTRTCAQQILYEVHDPAAYLTPDGVADFSGVRFEQVGPDAVAVSGLTGRPAPADLKVSVGYLDGFIGEGQIGYAGPNAAARARLALEVLAERLARRGDAMSETRFDLLGVDAVYRGPAVAAADPPEVYARAAARARTRDDADHVGHEVAALWLNGPAGGGGVTTRTREVLAIASTLLPRAEVRPSVTMLES